METWKSFDSPWDEAYEWLLDTSSFLPATILKSDDEDEILYLVQISLDNRGADYAIEVDFHARVYALNDDDSSARRFMQMGWNSSCPGVTPDENGCFVKYRNSLTSVEACLKECKSKILLPGQSAHVLEHRDGPDSGPNMAIFVSQRRKIQGKCHSGRVLTYAQNITFPHSSNVLELVLQPIFAIDSNWMQETVQSWSFKSVQLYAGKQLLSPSSEQAPSPDYGECVIEINIFDLNEAPIISNPAPVFNVSENLPSGAIVGFINATDEDFAQKLVFTLHPAPDAVNNPKAFFSIDSCTGILRTTRVIDYEMTQQFKMLIHVEDDGEPVKSAEAHVVVNIINVNENPIWRNCDGLLSASISDESLNGTLLTFEGKADSTLLFWDPDIFEAQNLNIEITTTCPGCFQKDTADPKNTFQGVIVNRTSMPDPYPDQMDPAPDPYFVEMYMLRIQVQDYTLIPEAGGKSFSLDVRITDGDDVRGISASCPISVGINPEVPPNIKPGGISPASCFRSGCEITITGDHFYSDATVEFCTLDRFICRECKNPVREITETGAYPEGTIKCMAPVGAGTVNVFVTSKRRWNWEAPFSFTYIKPSIFNSPDPDQGYTNGHSAVESRKYVSIFGYNILPPSQSIEDVQIMLFETISKQNWTAKVLQLQPAAYPAYEEIRIAFPTGWGSSVQMRLWTGVIGCAHAFVKEECKKKSLELDLASSQDPNFSWKYIRPQINNVNTHHGPTAGQTQLFINGSSFGSVGTVFFTGTLSSITRVCEVQTYDHTQIICLTARGIEHDMNIIVAVGLGITDPDQCTERPFLCSPLSQVDEKGNLKSFRFSYAPPIITYLHPKQGNTSGGYDIIIKGTDFGLDGADGTGFPLLFLHSYDGRKRVYSDKIVSYSSKMVRFKMPGGIGKDCQIEIGVPGGQIRKSSKPNVFTFDSAIVEWIYGPNPNSPGMIYGNVHQRVTFGGSNFGKTDDAKIWISGVPCEEIVWNLLQRSNVALSCNAKPSSVGYKNLSIFMAGQTGMGFEASTKEKVAQMKKGREKSFHPYLYSSCAPGFYGVDGADCIDCKTYFKGKATCLTGGLDEPVAAPHYYKIEKDPKSEETHVTPRRFLICTPKEACEGNNVCKLGYEGFLCAQCLKCTGKGLSCIPYYKLQNVCTKCPDNAILFLIGYILGGLTFVGLGIWLVTKIPSLAVISVGLDYFQILAVFSAFDVEWPSEVEKTFSAMSIFYANIEAASPECSVEFGFTTKWAVAQMMPLAIVVILLSVHTGIRIYKRKSGKWALKHSHEDENRHLSRLIQVLVIGLNFCYLFATKMALEIFACIEKEDGNYYLKSSGDMQCYTEEHALLMPIAVLCFIVYGLGIPSLFLLICFINRDIIKQDQMLRMKGQGFSRATNRYYEFRKRYYELYYRFQPRFWMWKGVVMIRKMLVVSVLVLFHQNAAFQASAGVLVLAVSALAHIHYKPYLSQDNFHQQAKLTPTGPKKGKSSISTLFSTAAGFSKPNNRRTQRRRALSNQENLKLLYASPDNKIARAERAAGFASNYNVVDGIFLISSVLILQCGLMYDAMRAEFTDTLNPRIALAKRYALTIFVLFVMWTSTAYFFFVLGKEIYQSRKYKYILEQKKKKRKVAKAIANAHGQRHFFEADSYSENSNLTQNTFQAFASTKDAFMTVNPLSALSASKNDESNIGIELTDKKQKEKNDDTFWKSVVDPTTGESYLWNTETGDTKWSDDDENDERDGESSSDGWQSEEDPVTGNKYWWHTGTGETCWEDPNPTKEENAEGESSSDDWQSEEDPVTGNKYWWHTGTGETCWEDPFKGEEETVDTQDSNSTQQFENPMLAKQKKGANNANKKEETQKKAQKKPQFKQEGSKAERLRAKRYNTVQTLSKIRRGKDFRTQKSARTLKRLQGDSQKKTRSRLDRMKKLKMNNLMKRAHAGEVIQQSLGDNKHSGSDGIFGKFNSAVYSFLRHDVDADQKARARDQEAVLANKIKDIMQQKDMSKGQAKFVQRALADVAANAPDFNAKSILQSKTAPNKQETEMIKIAMIEAVQSSRQPVDVDASGRDAHDKKKRSKPKRKASKRALRRKHRSEKKRLPSRRAPSGPGPAHVQLEEEV